MASNTYRKKKYRVIVKVGNDKFVKYGVDNLVKTTNFLDRAYPDWRWFNVYKYVKKGQGEQLASFTRHNRPRTAYLNV